MNKSILVLILFLASVTARSQVNYEKLDYYMYLFIKNIEWPDSINTDLFIVGVLGEGEAIPNIMDLEKNQPFFDKRIKVNHFDSVEDMDFCHMLFVPSSLNTPVKKILEKVSVHTLLVTEVPGQAFEGSGINIYWENKGKDIYFELNRSAFRRSGLKILPQLVSMSSH